MRTFYFTPVVSSSSFSPILCRHRLDVYYTRCSFIANLEGMSKMCWTRLDENTGRKKIAKNSPSVRHRTNLSGCISQLRHLSTIGKNLLNSNISSTCSHNMVNFGPLAAGIGLPVWSTPANLDGFRAQRMSTKLCTMFGRLLGWYTIHTFLGLLPPKGIWPDAKLTCIQVLRYPILAALLCSTRAVGVSQTLQHGIFT